MVDRIGDWYAFSSACYCRATTVYDTMAWSSGFSVDDPGGASSSPPDADEAGPSLFAYHPSFTMLDYCGAATAPFGGLVALLRPSDAGHNAPFLTDADATNRYAIDVFTSAGEYRITFGISARDGDVCGMEWTTEGVELCVLTAHHTCLFFDVGTVRDDSMKQGAEAPRGLLAPSASWCPCTRRASLTSPPDSAPASMRCFAVTSTSVVCADMSRRVRVLLHGERGQSRLLPTIVLPKPASEAPVESRFHVTAVALLPETRSETGESVLYWSQSIVNHQERIVCAADEHQLCALSTDRVDGGVEASGAATTLRIQARAHLLQLCPHDPRRLLLLTVRGTLHVVTADLRQQLFCMDFALATAAELIPHVSSTADDDAMDNASLTGGQNFSFTNASFLADGDNHLNSTTAAGLDGESAGASCVPSGAGAVATAATCFGLRHLLDGPVPSLLPTSITWCGTRFALLHYGSWRPHTDDAYDTEPSFSLLTCLRPTASVRCARLDWNLEGSSGRILCSSEVDGARVVTEERCLMLHEVPPSLADLCRLSPPYSASARVVLAFEEYSGGGYQGLAQVRATLLDPEGRVSSGGPSSAAPSPAHVLARASRTIFALVDAAMWEWDAVRQERLLAAASFACAMCQLPKGSTVLVDVMKRLRALRAVREEAQCHIPLTPCQYRALNGDWTAPPLVEACRGGEDGDNEDADSIQLSDTGEGDTLSETDADGDEDAADRYLIQKNEAAILVDRLVALGHYRLALLVASTLEARTSRVLTYWAQEQVRCSDVLTPTQELVSRIEQVLTHVPDASFVEAASAALEQGRHDLAQRLLQAEPRDDKKVSLLLQHGLCAAAVRCAADSADANLLFVAMDALVARTLSHSPASPADLQEVALLLQNSAIAERSFYCGAGFLASWRQLFSLLCTAHVVPRSLSAYKELGETLWGHSERQMRRLVRDVSLFLKPLDSLGLVDAADAEAEGQGTAKKSKKSKKRRTSVLSEADVDTASAVGDGGAGVYTLPPVEHSKLSASGVCEDLGPSELEQIVDDLLATAPSQRRWTASTASASAAADAAWLEQERDLETVREQLATRYQDNRFFNTASVVDVVGLLYAHNAADYAEKLAKAFKVPDRMRLFACLEVLCESGQWDRVDAFLGRPPPLRKAGLFSRGARGGDGAAEVLGYLPVVEVLLRHGQEERAVQFIPGVTEEAVSRVEWYMFLRAPVMAMEAAYVAHDAGLVEQVLAKVPATQTRVIEKGRELLRQLANDA